MTSKYPSQIDGYAEIRKAVDRRSEIIAADHNDLRSAVLAIENTLGLTPQGPFGTVVARLNDAYSNIEYHVLGNPPRHNDDVIMSPDRAGATPTALETLPYSLSSGTLADQISNILIFLNDALMYAGSGTTTFADGNSLGFSLIRTAITEIVSQLGSGTAGTSKISGAAITGTTFSVSAGTLRSQLVSLLNLIDAFGNITGAGLIGATGFTTSSGKYIFSGTDVQDQIEETGEFLDEGASFREVAFNSFVVSGMGVSGSGATATTASGFIFANGRMVEYAGGSVSVPDGSTSYVYAEINNGVVSVSNSTSIPTRAVNPVVLLHKIVRSGATWTTSTDIRRFGLFINDKNYISVGNTPASGEDGYGCDFTSLKSAVEYAKTINSGNELIPPLKIILVSDLTITSSSEMGIYLDVEGLEIDGCGRKIITTVDNVLFHIDADNITVKDLTLESNLAASGTTLCMAKIGYFESVEKISILNCKQTKTSATACPFFLLIGNSGATTRVSNSIFSGNIVEVALGGIEYLSTNSYDFGILNSVVTENIIYQGTFAVSSYYGIRVSTQCTVADNIIKGGFDTGIFLGLSTQCRVDGNLIIGYSSAVIYMGTGIEIWNNIAGQDNGCVISDNTIKGINSYGINCTGGSGSGAFISIFGNFIDNYNSVGTPPAGMIGIKGEGALIVGNTISGPGTYGIENCSYAVGNQIYGSSSVTSTTSAIKVATSSTGIVNDNIIRNVSGIGIDINSNTGVVVSGNALLGLATSSYAIYNASNECVISGNVISDYVSGGIYSSSGDEITVSNNRIIDCSGRGIFLSGCSGAIVIGNWLESLAGAGSKAISGIRSNSIISNNYISKYGTSGNYAIELYYLGSNISIIGNVIYDLNANCSGVLLTSSGWSKLTVIGNLINNCPGIGFYFNGASLITCSNNVFNGSTSANSCIVDFNEYSIISDNIILYYGASASSKGIVSYTGSGKSYITGNIIQKNRSGMTIGIDAAVDTYYVISNNIIGDGTDAPDVGIDLNGSSNSIISGNIINGEGVYIADGNGIKDVGSENIVSNNIIIGAGYNGINITGANGVISNNVIKNSVSVSLYCIADYTLISSNTIASSGNDGIKISGSDYCIISNNIIYQSADDGIELLNSNNTLILGNYSYQNNCGIYFDSADFVSVSNNFFEDSLTWADIFNESGDYCSFVGNRFSNGAAGAIYSAGSYASICSNYVYNCGGNAIEIDGTGGKILISSNYIYDSAAKGIYINSTSNYCDIIGNLIYDCVFEGIDNESGFTNINGNLIQTAGASSIKCLGSYSNISNNTIRSGASHGIEVEGSDLVISNNSIISMTSDGIHATASGSLAWSSVCGNYIYNVVYGIIGNGTSDGANIMGNIIKNASAVYGVIALLAADHIVISSNIIDGFSTIAINIASCTDGIVMGNKAKGCTGTNGVGLTLAGASGLTIVGNWMEGAGTSNPFYFGDFLTPADQCVMIGNLSEGGATSDGFTTISGLQYSHSYEK